MKSLYIIILLAASPVLAYDWQDVREERERQLRDFDESSYRQYEIDQLEQINESIQDQQRYQDDYYQLPSFDNPRW